jgi:hypothetical protein
MSDSYTTHIDGREYRRTLRDKRIHSEINEGGKWVPMEKIHDFPDHGSAQAAFRQMRENENPEPTSEEVEQARADSLLEEDEQERKQNIEMAHKKGWQFQPGTGWLDETGTWRLDDLGREL